MMYTSVATFRAISSVKRAKQKELLMFQCFGSGSGVVIQNQNIEHWFRFLRWENLMVLLTLFHLYPIQICWKKVTFLRFKCFIGPVSFTWFTLFFSILETYSTDGHRGFAFDHRSITPKFVTLTALSCIDNSWRSTTLSPPKKLTSSTANLEWCHVHFIHDSCSTFIRRVMGPSKNSM